MKAQKTTFVCRECGYNSIKWLGKCPECQSWDSFDEELIAPPTAEKKGRVTAVSSSRAEKITELTLPEYIRAGTGMNELDRVLGGGLVNGSVVLLSGEPGIGKSTLLLQISSELGKNRKVLYVSGEESKGQIKIRAERLNIACDSLYLLTETDVD